MAQTKNVDLKKGVFDKTQYEKVIDTNFSQLGVTSVSASAEETISVEEFFGYYNDIFYDIPPTGDTNSHQFLVKSSGEYINADSIAEEILALQEEISSLRRELLQNEIRVAELESGTTIDTGSLDLGTDTSIDNSNTTSIVSTNISSQGAPANLGTGASGGGGGY
tara:strand:+ start:501 stop:995 length:495 start_codon:yes stop_codon:yes gene_type:complete